MSANLLRQLHIRGFDALGPGIDPALIWLLKRYHFPSSRLWAAANASDGDLEAFADRLPDRQAKRAGGAVARQAFAAHGDAKSAAEEATADWREVALGGRDGDVAAAETRRRRAATKHLATMMPLAAAVGRRGLPLVDWAMHPAAHAPPPPGPDAFAAPDDLNGVEPGSVYQEGPMLRQWVAAPAETGLPGDLALARATWPADGEVRGAVVAGSGVGVDWDLYVRARPGYDFSAAFPDHGLAVLEMVSPGHGLRLQRGRYGGEAFFAGAPTSAANLLRSQCREAARFIALAKARWERPAGIFGLSMSSFAAQLVLSHSHSWPEAARPDGGFLLAHAGDLMGVVKGKLSRALGVQPAMHEAGWTEESLEPWRQALRPLEAPAIAGERIISVTGYLDRVTPFRDGGRLAGQWGLPRANRFRMPHGHMSLPRRLDLDDTPIKRFAEVLSGGGVATGARARSVSDAGSVGGAVEEGAT